MTKLTPICLLSFPLVGSFSAQFSDLDEDGNVDLIRSGENKNILE